MSRILPTRSYPAFTKYETEAFEHCRAIGAAYRRLNHALDPDIQGRLGRSTGQGAGVFFEALLSGPRAAEPSLVYAMTTKSLVKIGVTRSLELRFTTLRSGVKGTLHLAAYLEGDRDDERRLHAALLKWHVEGEWFRRNSNVDTLLAELKHVWTVPGAEELRRMLSLSSSRPAAAREARGSSPYLQWAREQTLTAAQQHQEAALGSTAQHAAEPAAPNPPTEVSVSINAIVHVFEGDNLQTIEWDGKPCWEASHLGRLLGYSENGGRLAKKVLQVWAKDIPEGCDKPELVEGRDYAFLQGPELEAFKAVSDIGLHRTPLEGTDRRNKLLVLFESGANLCLLKTNKPKGVRMRRFLADEVMPQLARTGTYAPATPAPASDAALVARVEAIEQRITATVTTAVASAVTAALSPLQQAMTALTHAVTALVQSHAQQPAPAAGVTTVHTNGAQIRLVQPEVPKDFTVTGLQRLADTAGCGSDKMKKRLQDAGLWGDTTWVWQGHQSVVRGDRVKQEKLYVFRKGILAELHNRENPLFNGKGDA